jgi:nonsense-mediated mRNA decay protein 3
LFCVECGREGELIGALCKDCYSKKHAKASLPEHVDVTLCAHCSAMQTDHGWKDVGSVKEAAEAAIESALQVTKDAKVNGISVRLVEQDERNLEAGVTARLTSNGVEMERELSTVVRLKRGSCTECSKQQGRYYEAILQVRGPGKTLDEAEERAIERVVKGRVGTLRKSSREVFISKTESVKGGLDFYFSTIPAAKSIARELQETMCAEYKESSSLWGRRDGKEVYRMTFLVRLPGFSPGDVVEYQSRAYYIKGMSRGVVHGIDLVTGEERALKPKTAGECALEQPRGKILRAVVLTEKAGELQVLDPDTMAVMEVKTPPGFERRGDQIRLAKTKLGVYAISDGW